MITRPTTYIRCIHQEPYLFLFLFLNLNYNFIGSKKPIILYPNKPSSSISHTFEPNFTGGLNFILVNVQF